MERSREGWYERFEEKKVTLDWLSVNCNLTQRESELLQIIYDRKLVRRDLLEIISPSYRNTGENRTKLLNRAIKKMFKKMIIDKVHEPQQIGKGNTPCIVAIDKGGSLLLNTTHKRRIIHNKTTHDGKEYITRRLPSNYKHIHGVNKLEVDTILFCESNNFEIIEWRLEQSKTFFSNQEKISLIPDVLMIIDIGGKHLVAFIEFDTGSEGIREKEPKVIVEKIKKYRQYMMSKIWEEEDWQKHFKQPIFPIVLFVTEDSNRVDFFNQKAKEHKIRGVGVYHTKYEKVLEKLATLVK